MFVFLTVWAMVMLLGITFSLLTAAYISHKYLFTVSAIKVDANYGAATGSTSLSDETPQYFKDSPSIKGILTFTVLNGIRMYSVSESNHFVLFSICF